MNCKQIQELLPLYVGRDLEKERAQMVGAHMKTCVECSDSASEYRETRQWLQQFAPPQFNETVYAGIRQGVWREIGRESTRLPRLIANLFRPPVRWAFATVLLILVVLFAFYVNPNRTNDLRDARRLAHGGSTDGPKPASLKENEEFPQANAVQKRAAFQGLTAGTHQAQRRKSPAAEADRAKYVASNRLEARSINAEAGREDNGPAPDAALINDPARSEKPLRMEIQTRDPNIRIIWFTHQPIKSESP